MTLPPLLGITLIVAGVWPLLVWPRFLIRVVRDPRSRDEAGRATRFLTVHLMLVTISLLFGAATAIIGVRSLMG